MATVSIRQANKKGTRSRKMRQQLLPGIPDEITLREISPKLPWRVFYILSAVSQAWGHAIRSRKVYDARVLSHSTEAFVIVNLDFFRGGIGLWSTRDNSLIELPHFGHRSQHLVSVDGRIYLLGRKEQYSGILDLEQVYDSVTSAKVFVLDVAAGERQWRKCSRMIERRRNFNGAVIDGKVYVCGGDKVERGSSKFCGSEVYDPKKDLWSPIKPMAERYNHRTEAVGKELYVHSGQSGSGEDRSSFLNVYHPGKDEWRVVSPFGSGTFRRQLLFVAQGKLHSVDTFLGIDVYNVEENSWTELHPFSLIDPDGSVRMDDKRTAIVHVDDELLLKYWVRTTLHNYDYIKENVCLAKSNGFGSDNKRIWWQKVPLTNSQKELLENTRGLTSIQL